MKIVVLVDNNTLNDKYYLGEPAVSFYIVDGKSRLLFDTGYSDAFLKNASLMQINLNEIESIVISHGHEDHTNGLKYFLDHLRSKKIKLFSHPLAFNKKKLNDEKICSPYSLNLVSEYFDVYTSKKPVKVTENIIFLGEIPTKFESRKPMGLIKEIDEYHDDYLYDDSAIVYKGKQGLFIISGCSHSGICNILEYAKEVCEDSRIYGVIGGFHLGNNKKQIQKTIEYFKKNKIKNIYPCHCTSLYAKSEFVKELGTIVKEVGVGLKIRVK